MSLYSAFYDNWTPDMIRPAKVVDMAKDFKKAFDSTRPYKGVIQAMRQGVPFHVGTLTDPFQVRELKEEVTQGFLKLCIEYDHPVVISTKSAIHWFHPKIRKLMLELPKVIVQASITSTDKELSRKLEPKAPSGLTRVKVLEHFKDVGITAVARFQPIIPRINDHLIHATMEDLADRVDLVNIRDYMMSGNKTIRNFWIKEFGVDVYDLLAQSEPLTVEGAQKVYNSEIMTKYMIKIKNLANSLGMKANVDTCYGFMWSDYNHCCGGDGVKGFNPKGEWDLQKVGIFNTANVKYWVKVLLNEGKIDFQRAFKQEPYESRHADIIYSRWFWGTDLKIMGLTQHEAPDPDIVEHEDIVYHFKPNDHFRECQALVDEKVILGEDERLEPEIGYYDV